MEEKYFIKKWLNNDISEEELEAFKKFDTYEISAAIIDGISKLAVAEYPEDLAYEEFKTKLENSASSSTEVDENHLLGKWLNNDMSEEQREAFMQSEEYSDYIEIIDGISKLAVAEYPEDLAYEEFKAKLENEFLTPTGMDEDHLLGKWLNDSISNEELEKLKQSEAYTDYTTIIDGVAKLSVEEYPEDVAYLEFKQKLERSTDTSAATNDDHFLGKWLNNSLSPDELNKFEQSEDYADYAAIINGVPKLTVKAYPEEVAYREFKEELESRSKSNTAKVIKMPLMRYVAVAASFVLLLGIGYFATNKTYETQVASQENILLPDNSRVILNAKSELSYNKVLFYLNRNIHLDGEAFFEVEKGSTFSVLTENGSVKVLGTKFNVTTRDNYFETSCFEGKVGVKTANDSKILTKGKSVRFIDQIKEREGEFNADQPSWMEGMSRFKSTSLKYVIEDLEIHFGVTFTIDKKIDTSSLYTGAFSHDNIKNAMENVFPPMGIMYSVDNENKTITLKKR